MFFTVSVATMLRLSAWVKAVSTLPCAVAPPKLRSEPIIFVRYTHTCERGRGHVAIVSAVIRTQPPTNHARGLTYNKEDLRRELDEVVAVPLAVELWRWGIRGRVKTNQFSDACSPSPGPAGD